MCVCVMDTILLQQKKVKVHHYAGPQYDSTNIVNERFECARASILGANFAMSKCSMSDYVATWFC